MLQLSGQFVVSLKIKNLLPPIKEPHKIEENEFSDRFEIFTDYLQLRMLICFTTNKIFFSRHHTYS